MKSFSGKTAFITGGASGIGYATAQAFLNEGMNVMIADIDEQSLHNATSTLDTEKGQLSSLVCDVTDFHALHQAEETTTARFGNVHILFNNAGVNIVGLAEEVSLEDWQWCIDINQWGVINGIKAFLPHMKAHGESGHIITTASVAGMGGAPTMSPYCVAKFAVVGITECLQGELENTALGASVLCPGAVKTHIFAEGHARTTDSTMQKPFADMVSSGMSPTTVAARIIESIRAGDRYIFTHPELTAEVLENRHANLQRAMESCRQSKVLHQ